MYQAMYPINSQHQVHATMILITDVMVHPMIQPMRHLIIQSLILFIFQAHLHKKQQVMHPLMQQHVRDSNIK